MEGDGGLVGVRLDPLHYTLTPFIQRSPRGDSSNFLSGTTVLKKTTEYGHESIHSLGSCSTDQ